MFTSDNRSTELKDGTKVGGLFKKIFYIIFMIFIFSSCGLTPKAIDNRNKKDLLNTKQADFKDSTVQFTPSKSISAQLNSVEKPIIFVRNLFETEYTFESDYFTIPNRCNGSAFNFKKTPPDHIKKFFIDKKYPPVGFNVYVNGLKNKFQLYSIRAFDNWYSYSLYNNLDETEDYIKLSRVIISIPVKVSDKTDIIIQRKKKYKGLVTWRLIRNQIIYETLEKKLFEKVKKLNGDGVIDLCIYLHDYNSLDEKTTITKYLKITDYLFQMDVSLTGTIIKFKNGHFPNPTFQINPVE